MSKTKKTIRKATERFVLLTISSTAMYIGISLNTGIWNFDLWPVHAQCLFVGGWFIFVFLFLGDIMGKMIETLIKDKTNEKY